MALLDVNGLSKRFGDIEAVAGVSLAVEPGEIFGLIGPDGAGKTTSLRLMVGVLDPDEGETFVEGVSVAKKPERVRERLGYMPQQYSLYGDLTVAENLRFFADMYFVPRKKRRERLARLYEFSRLEPYRKRPAAKLSGGMYKKLALSCNMIHTPRLLLLDEPTTGVDPLSRRELWEILYSFAAEGVGIVVSTPYMDEAERCHRVGLMHEGKFLLTDSPRAILDRFEGELVEVVPENLEAAQDALGAAPDVRRCYPTGVALKVALSAGVKAQRVAEILGEKRLVFSALEAVRPTFEDVFLALVEPAR